MDQAEINKAAEALKEYVPFGPEWTAYLSKKPKAFLIEMIRHALAQNAERKEMTDFWKSAWEEDATREMIINELHDYTVYMESTAKVYEHLTRGNISKVNTLPQVVIDEVERIHQQEIDEAVAEAPPSVLKAATELYRLKAIKEKIQTGYATKEEADDYFANKDSAWSALGTALGEQPIEVLPQPGCDYRKPGCVNEGEVINGAWVCANHRPHY